MKYRWLAFWVIVVLVFVGEVHSQLSAPHHTVYRLIAAGMSVMGALFGAFMAWKEFRALRQ